MSPRSVGSTDLTRRRGTRRERPRILIVTEGVRTEREYFEGLAQFARATGVDFCTATVVGLGRDPRRVVEEAIRRKAEDRRANARQDRYSRIWCVFDVDTHDTLGEAIALAHSNEIGVAVSNPCFEIWLLWHFEDQRAGIEAKILARRLRRHGFVDKSIPRGFSFARHADALIRASTQPDTQPYAAPANPGTSVPGLVVLVARQTLTAG